MRAIYHVFKSVLPEAMQYRTNMNQLCLVITHPFLLIFLIFYPFEGNDIGIEKNMNNSYITSNYSYNISYEKNGSDYDDNGISNGKVTKKMEIEDIVIMDELKGTPWED